MRAAGRRGRQAGAGGATRNTRLRGDYRPQHRWLVHLADVLLRGEVSGLFNNKRRRVAINQDLRCSSAAAYTSHARAHHFVRDHWRGRNNSSAKLVTQALVEHIHVQQSQETATKPESEGAARHSRII